MSTHVSPVLRRRQLGRRLKAERLRLEMSVGDAARAARFSPAKLTRLELAERGPQEADIRKLADVYGVPDEERSEWIALTEDAQRRGWWQEYRFIRNETAIYFGLEDAATRIRWFEASRMPGLLQSQRYAHATVREYVRTLDVSEDMIRAQSEVPARRASRLVVEPTIHLEVIIDEAVITRQVGSPEIMAEQLEHMIELAERPNVEIRLVPFSVGNYPGTEGSFTILDFDPVEEIPTSIFVEGHLGTFLLDKPSDQLRYEDFFQSIHVLACEPADTTEILRRGAERFRATPDQYASPSHTPRRGSSA